MANIEGMETAHDPFVGKASRNREAYFARFAPEIRQRLKRAKLMVTGSFRAAQGMIDAIANDGTDMIGLARPLCLDPAAPAATLTGEPANFPQPEDRLRLGPKPLGSRSPIKLLRTINGPGFMGWYNEQSIRMAAGPRDELSADVHQHAEARHALGRGAGPRGRKTRGGRKGGISR
jgi:hypothetical protein